jgi:murein L,D-transpeptidase YafK
MPRPQRCAALFLFAVSVLPLGACCQIFGCGPLASLEPAATPPRPDRIVVFKSRRILELRRGDTILATFPIALGPHPHGPKREAGDGRTPQGRYIIDWRSADTRYHRELHISYPDASDLAHAQAMHVEPGGEIFIHGLPPGFGNYDPVRFDRDWTEGCVAVSDAAIDKIWRAIPDGTVVDILP